MDVAKNAMVKSLAAVNVIKERVSTNLILNIKKSSPVISKIDSKIAETIKLYGPNEMIPPEERIV